MTAFTAIVQSIAIYLFITNNKIVFACQNIELSSNELGTVQFNQLSVELSQQFGNGRPSYISAVRENPIYLYHTSTSDPSSGIGRWVVGRELGVKDAAMAFINSWAVLPYLTDSVADTKSINNNWMIPSTDGWEIDTSVLVNCLDDDSTIFLETHPYYQPTTAGFYVKRYVESTNAYQGVLYTQIRNRETDHQLYLFKLPDTDNWMIGEVFGVDAGMAFVTDPAADPTGILNKRWRYVTSDGWLEENGNIICGKCQGFSLSTYSHENVYEVLRFARSIKFVPKGQNFVKLRNGIPMPYLGLGTGGIYREETFGVVSQALAKGYRVLDLAREYGNEHIIAEIFLATKDTPNFPRREEIFLETKVWPTDLGFLPTTDAIEASLRSLRTNYIDLYLIHWPSCNPEIEWMHCHTTVDPSGTWQQSWRALEKAYAEGRVVSIGVSNFDIQLLNELREISLLLPHLVQNWAEPGSLDRQVRSWCDSRRIVYQPYASGRNLEHLQAMIATALEEIAAAHNRSEYSIALRFFLQTGAAVIPRTRQLNHLEENLRVYDFELTDGEMARLGWDVHAPKVFDEL